MDSGRGRLLLPLLDWEGRPAAAAAAAAAPPSAACASAAHSGSSLRASAHSASCRGGGRASGVRRPVTAGLSGCLLAPPSRVNSSQALSWPLDTLSRHASRTAGHAPASSCC